MALKGSPAQERPLLDRLSWKTSGEMRTRPEPRSVGSNRLVARDSHPTFFLISLASKCRFEFCLLTGRNKERVFLSVFDNLLCHNLALETAQCALNRFTLINSNYSHSLVAFLLFDQLKLIKHGRGGVGQASGGCCRFPIPTSRDCPFLLSAVKR
jgi:hypothetical protein